MQNNSENQGLMGNFHSSLPHHLKSAWETDHLVAKTSLPGLQEKQLWKTDQKERNIQRGAR